MPVKSMNEPTDSKQKNKAETKPLPPRNPDGTFRSTGGNSKPSAPNRKKAKKLLQRVELEQVIAGLQGGTLDRRTKTSIQFEAVKEALAQDPARVSSELLRHDIAVYAVISRAILEYVQNSQGSLVDSNGELLPLIRNDFPRFQTAMTKSIDALMKLDSKAKAKGQSNVADIVLELAQEE